MDVGRDDGALIAGCIGVVKGIAPGAVGQRLHVDDSSVREATVEEAWGLSESDFGNDVVQITPLSDAVVTFEPNGWRGVDPGVAAALSEQGRYAAYFWNVNSLMQFAFAEAGSVVPAFDPLLYDNDAGRTEALAEEEGLPWPSDDAPSLRPGQASLALIERLTGVEIHRGWLLGARHATYRVKPDPNANEP